MWGWICSSVEKQAEATDRLNIGGDVSPVCLLFTAGPAAPLKLEVKVVCVSREQNHRFTSRDPQPPFSLFISHKVHDKAKKNKKQNRLKAYFVALQPGGTL